jgi:hypothetical protein
MIRGTASHRKQSVGNDAGLEEMEDEKRLPGVEGGLSCIFSLQHGRQRHDRWD